MTFIFCIVINTYPLRFGPGLVIYWFGYVEELEILHQNRTILIRDSLPANLVLMDPFSLIDEIKLKPAELNKN